MREDWDIASARQEEHCFFYFPLSLLFLFFLLYFSLIDY